MIVSRQNFSEIVSKLSLCGSYGLDTETTGLRASDRLFSVIFADAEQGYYFNFNEHPDHLGNRAPAEFTLPRSWIEELASILSNKLSLFFLHNAKFDMGMLAKDGLSVLGTVHCTEAMERVFKNNYFGHKPYSLKSCAKRRGLAKDDTVDDYITKHGLFTDIKVPGKDKLQRLKHFELVPFGIITPYGCTDGVITRAIGLDQIDKIKAAEAELPNQAPRRWPVVENERRLTKSCFRIENHGIKIDRPYVEKALTHTLAEADAAIVKFQEVTGIKYENSADVLDSVFRKFGKELPKTKTGKPCTNKKVLEGLDHPVADLIRDIRKPQKLASTYYSSFLYFADDHDIVRSNIRQGGTETGRFSCSEPNIQNLPKEDDESDLHKPYLVRRSFIPLDSDWCFVPVDYKQQEFRMMLDYAGELGMIRLIQSGMDVHEATARIMGITRKQAKTINFGLLYGMGTGKLAVSLGVSVRTAQEMKADYFQKMPRVRTLINGVKNSAISRGYIWNWFGFRNYYSPLFGSHPLPNHLIQGGCGQVLRVALVQLDELLVSKKMRTHIVAQVHDEILFQVHKSEFDILPECIRIMENVYTPKAGLRLECSSEYSYSSWAKNAMKAGLPSLAASA